MPNLNKDLYVLLKNGPAFLFLGQNYLSLESGNDPFLSEILRKFNSAVETQDKYYDIFEGDAYLAIDSSLNWMQERCSRLSAPKSLKTISKIAWNGIYTSAIDVIWQKDFRMDSRTLQPIFEEKFNPANPRNRSKLTCTYLFGNVGQSEKSKIPPLEEFEFHARKQVAISLARRLPELISPFGVLIIEGYAGDCDWFAPTDLVPIINQLNQNQTHIFSASENIKKNRLIAKLVKNGKITLHDESLASYLSRGEQLGYIKLEFGEFEQGDLDRRIQIGDYSYYVPEDIWNDVTNSSKILDDTVIANVKAISEERLYYDFRTFLLESSIKPIWSGYERKFNFVRKFESDLYNKTISKMKVNKLHQEPIILHGQTGSGKTVALGSLAYRFKKEKSYPVLYIGKNIQQPYDDDIALFCQWAEKNDISPVLIIWDGMLNLDAYYNLQRKLASRGRKAIIVGSTYRIEKSDEFNHNFIEASVTLDEEEKNDFKEFISNFGIKFNSDFQDALDKYRETFLVALYRLLPPTRGHIRTGIQQETKIAESILKELFQKKNVTPVNIFADAFIQAGIINSDFLLDSQEKEIDGEKIDAVEELIDLVVVPGQFGLFVPVELLLRSWNKVGYVDFFSIREKTDIIRVDEDDLGNIRVGPRHPLEAKLLVQSRLGTSKAQISFISQLLSEITDNSGSRSLEIDFAIELLKKIGPNCPESHIFSPYYKEIALTVGMLREERNIHNPRLMLQEATFLREYVIDQSRKKNTPLDSIRLLDKAEKVIDAAFHLLESSRATRWSNFMKSAILVELASVLGARIEYLLDENKLSSNEAVKLNKKARQTVFKATNFNPDNYYPIDVQAWITLDLLKSEILNPQEEADIQADILFSFETVEAEDFDPQQQINFNRRKLEIANYLKLDKLSKESFDALERSGSLAGYYLTAYQIIKDVKKNATLSRDEKLKCENAVNYLKEHYHKISNDTQCLYLLLNTWWKTKTGKPMFYGEKQTVPLDDNDWKYCLEIVSKIIDIGDLASKPSLVYLKALALYHIGSVKEAISLFRDLESSTYHLGKRRIIKSYLASNNFGGPIKYHGTVYSISGNGKNGKIYVEELRQVIHFSPTDFNRPNIDKNEAIDFYIAFNFISPVAIPLHSLSLSSGSF